MRKLEGPPTEKEENQAHKGGAAPTAGCWDVFAQDTLAKTSSQSDAAPPNP